MIVLVWTFFAGVVLCSSSGLIANAAPGVSPNVTSNQVVSVRSSIFSDLPDELFTTLALEYALHDVPHIMKFSKSIRERAIAHAVFQRYLAAKFRFPPLMKLPFENDLLKLVYPEECHYNAVLNPNCLFELLGRSFQPTPVFENITLLLFDRFMNLSFRRVNISNLTYSQYVLSVILNRRGLKSYIRSKRWLKLADDIFGSVPNIQELLQKWFTKEYESFKKLFFSPDGPWDLIVTLAFFEAPGTRLPAELSLEDCGPFLCCLDYFIKSELINDPDLEMRIFEKCSDFIEAHRPAAPLLANSFNAHFNPNFRYQFSPYEDPIASRNIANLLVNLGRYDKALELLRDIKAVLGLRIPECSAKFLHFPDFLNYFIFWDAQLCRWYLKELPAHFYTDPTAVDTVMAFYGSIRDFLRTEKDLKSAHFLNLIQFIVRFGNASEFEAAVTRSLDFMAGNLLNELFRYRKNAPDMKKWIEHWRSAMETWYRNLLYPKKPTHYWSSVHLRILLSHPGAVECLQGFKVMPLSPAALERIKAFPQYQDASEEVKLILEDFAEIKVKP